MNNPHEYFHDMYLNTTTEIFVDLKKKKSGVSWLSNIVGNKQTKKKNKNGCVGEKKKRKKANNRKNLYTDKGSKQLIIIY